MAVEGEVAGVLENKAERVFTWEVEGCKEASKGKVEDQRIAKHCLKDKL